MAWRRHDSSVADPLRRPSDYNALDVAKLLEVVISLHRPPLSILYVEGLFNVWKHVGHAFSIKDSEGKVITMAEFLRLPNFKGCKVFIRALLLPGFARVNHLAPPAKREGPSKKRRVRVRPQVAPDSEHVSSSTPLNQAKPLEALADEERVSTPLSGNVDASHVIEGHGNNEGDLSGLQTRPSPAYHSDHRKYKEEDEMKIK
nr:hypothetical protein [Tanacetum cinerariifolium]